MRRFAGVLVALVVLVAAAIAIGNYLASGESALELVLERADGAVTVQRHGEQVQAAVGLRLDANDRLSTAAGGGAVLALGSETKIRVGPTSSMQITSVDEDGVRVELEGGRIEATVRPESGSVRVGNRDREVVATNADFRMAVDGGIVQVETTRGEVLLSGTDETVVAAGEQATIVDRHAALGPVPEDLLLEVAWPEAERTRASVSVVEGTTAPGAEVTIRGAFDPVVVRADGDGRFQAEVRLGEGDNRVDVVAVDPLGRESEVMAGSLQVRDTRGPRWKGGVSYED
ncbi:MAG: hypothetical protein ACI8PZ_001094 [Myxococcota bacterium]